MNASKTATITVEEVLDGQHPAVVLRLPVATGNGILAPGRILAKDGNGKMVPYVNGDETAGTAYGVALGYADTTALSGDDAINVLKHGTCKRSKLIVADEVDVVQADVDSLVSAGVYPL